MNGWRFLRGNRLVDLYIAVMVTVIVVLFVVDHS